VTGAVSIRGDSRVSLWDQANIRRDLMPTGGYGSVATMGPGQIAVDNDSTRGNIINDNCNRWLSPHRNIALLPRAIAEEDFPNHCAVSVTL
jgi:hypothetical protein